MRVPILRGVIDRRMLLNFRVRPEAIARLLPVPFQPRLVQGYAMAGVCLIRLKQIRPRFLPAPLGISSENAAHRIAVEWEQDGKLHQGVYIPRRDTSSRFATASRSGRCACVGWTAAGSPRSSGSRCWRRRAAAGSATP